MEYKICDFPLLVYFSITFDICVKAFMNKCQCSPDINNTATMELISFKPHDYSSVSDY